ncbi:MAG TPA: hypothetical protein VHF22_14970, partial [Planctomycetota bacterium]|nr:hypothetical protein [Planctomycetota bacterium]
MRTQASIAFAAILFICGAAQAQHLVKPDAAVVARTKKALARAADLAPDAAARAAALEEVRATAKMERFEALAQSMESSAKKVRALAAAELAGMGEHAGLAVLVQGIVREGDRATRAEMTKALAALDARFKPGAATPAGPAEGAAKPAGADDAAAAQAPVAAGRGGSDAGALFAAFLAEKEPRRRIHAMQGISVFPDARAIPALVREVESIAAGFGRAAAE